MHLTLVQPCIGRINGKKFIRPWTLEPLNIITLAGLTPKGIDVTFFDDRIEDVNYDIDTDLVGISTDTFSALRAYEIAKEFRSRGKKVIMGGVHPTLMPEESLRHSDSVFTGQAERLWNKVIEDAKKGRLERIYSGGNQGFEGQRTNREIIKGNKYSPVSLIEFGRGCPNRCDFCDIPIYFDGKYFSRNPDDFVRELLETKKKRFLVVDDNVSANHTKLEELCDSLNGLGITWYSQATANIGTNERLLDKLKSSGCGGLLIGFESIDEDNLRARNKKQNIKQDYKQLIRKLQDRGIWVYGSFIVGNEYDTKEGIDKLVDFSIENKLMMANFNPLVPIPRTPLYKKLEHEDRLLMKDWWLNPNYRYGSCVVKPYKMTTQETEDACIQAKERFYGISGTLQRLPLTHPSDIPAFLFINSKTRSEVKQKNECYIGLTGKEL